MSSSKDADSYHDPVNLWFTGMAVFVISDQPINNWQLLVLTVKDCKVEITGKIIERGNSMKPDYSKEISPKTVTSKNGGWVFHLD